MDGRSTKMHTNTGWWVISANSGQRRPSLLQTPFVFKCGDKFSSHICHSAVRRAASALISRVIGTDVDPFTFQRRLWAPPEHSFQPLPRKDETCLRSGLRRRRPGLRHLSAVSLCLPPPPPSASSICFSASKVTSDGVGGRQRGVG